MQLIYINTFDTKHLKLSMIYGRLLHFSAFIYNYVEGEKLYIYIYIYQVYHELRSLLRESVPYVKIYRYNPKHLYPKLNGYGYNGQGRLKL